ncbi:MULTISPECIES: nitrite reductase (NAD(P)H) small subunit [Mycobacteriaceae]|uniref:nitrite reductase (NAD(P)H) small subunit n=1 Tax=Mycobacteriaceae TaxID=1762 RepID=UPI0007FC2D35|nr:MULTISPECIES: nitrite reductase (NAD(P)H) small subunit [Mycobacteriaceae]MCK0177226.1 nitrite reductase (NAD(P)H) small subunit [Mycolicibacterium sp. F2034L]OBB59536.1 nitrite reductase small subunit [Mycobacterium sp. 852013-51886_SCH5428379]
MTLVDSRTEDASVQSSSQVSGWTRACRYDFLIPGRGVGVLLPDGAQAALFRLDDGSLCAIGNIDPFSGAAVMSRGITGDRGGRATVQSPIKKQAFAFDDGSCLDDPAVSLPVYRTRIVDGYAEIAPGYAAAGGGFGS